ncbi:MAG: hypothetical protein ACYTF6_06100 [Planctomycetota bacterium]|jgi:hypothetical protein
MRNIAPAIFFLAFVIGCNGEPQDVRGAFQPGAKLLLKHTASVVTTGVSVTSTGVHSARKDGGASRSVETRREETKFTETGSLTQELAITALRDDAGRTLLTLTVQRMISAGGYVDEKGDGWSESWDSAAPPKEGTETSESQAHFEELKSQPFVFALDEAGAISRVKRGSQWLGRRELRRALAGSAAEEGGIEAASYLSILEDSLAYRPPDGVRVGQTWGVRRTEVVWPFLYQFYMATGAAAVSENSTCRLKSVYHDLGCRVGLIEVNGRWEYLPGLTEERRMKSMLVSGTIRTDLDSGRILQQRIVVECTYKPGQLPGTEISFISALTLEGGE